MITNPVAIFSILSMVVFGTIWLERFKNFRKLGAAAASILFAMVLSNAGLLPGEPSVYDFFTGYGVLAGTVLILLSVDLSSIKAAGSTMAIATARGYNSRILPGVAVGIIGTAIGNYIGLAVGNLMRIML